MTWSTGQKPNVAESCDWCNAGTATFIMADDVFSAIYKMCDEIKTEWQMLLIGEEQENNTVLIVDYYIPKQRVTSASVKMNECMDLERVKELGIIATIHSHADMGVFFSGVDYTDTNTSFIKNHIVVNNKHEFVATKAIDLPCGMKKFIDAVVTRDIPAVVMAKEVKGIDKVEKVVYTPSTPYTPHKSKYSSLFADNWDSDYGGLLDPPEKSKRKKHAFDMYGEKGGYADELT